MRGKAQNGETAYAYDYREIGQFKELCKELGVSVLIVHHTRKQKDDDSFNTISGTTGIMGAADTTFILSKNNRSDKTATLKLTGRDVRENAYILSFDPVSCEWKSEGTQEEKRRKEFMQDYRSSPVVVAIKRLVNCSTKSWSGTASELLDEMEIPSDGQEWTDRRVAKDIEKFETALKNIDGISHKFIRKSNGRIHTFEQEKDKN